MVQIQIFNNKEEASQYVLQRFADLLDHTSPTFGLATGSTPETLYALLRESDLDFSKAIGINLDEYYGLDANHPQSYAYFMNEQLFKAKPFKHTYIPNGQNTNVEEETSTYEDILSQHPIDLQILGIGTNAHIGFNEPGTPFDSQTHLVSLTPSTIASNQRFFEDASQVPQKAYSMGIHSIMNAKEIILMAFGEDKAEAIVQTIEGPIHTDVPASILQTHHHVTFVLDRAAASKLQKETIQTGE